MTVCANPRCTMELVDEDDPYCGNDCEIEHLRAQLDEARTKLADPFAWVTPALLREVAIRLERDADPEADPDDVLDVTVQAVRAWWAEFVEADGADWDDYGEHFVNALHHGIRQDVANGHWKLGEGRA